MNVNNALSRGLDALTVAALALAAFKVAAWAERYRRTGRTPSASDAASAIAEGAAVVAA